MLAAIVRSSHTIMKMKAAVPWDTVVKSNEFNVLMDTVKGSYSEFKNINVPMIDDENYSVMYDDKKIKVMLMAMRKWITYPLHDHPDMLVLSLLLKGKVRIDSLDLDLPSLDPSTYKPRVGDR